ncbi:hypothetical protein GIB67_037752 [Kingdonia uniflora]|uniref:WAT1-related protein n=1 Tax=Kingdonia uniflora TaxID=39325 RepID=A0A7J7LV81_9MAGN|nr:hypothetical protein GIB67_037752 [Kingdonia uniflora]
MRSSSSVWSVLPFVGMVAVECLDVGLTTLSKAAMSRGMSHFVFVLYSNTLATLVLFPSSLLLFHRTKRPPPLSLSLLCRFFILGLLGITLMQNCVFTGISYSSPTLGSALSNLIPAFTFIMSIVFRIEKLDLRSFSSQVKIMGTIVSIIGALIVTLYKGPPIGRTMETLFPSEVQSSPPNWILGGLFITIACLSFSIWIILQAATVKEYPAELIIVSFNSFFGTIQCAVISLIAERNQNVWRLRPDVELISIIYSALIGSVITPGVVTWCIHKKGPVFVAMFKPLSIAIAAIMGVIFLGDTLRVGSVIGAIVIAVGFYGVIWGQLKEEKQEVEDNGFGGLRSSAYTSPLLQNYREE